MDNNAIYFVDYYTKNVERFDLGTKSLTTLITSSNSSEGNVFINGEFVFFNLNGNIAQVPKTGGAVTTLVNTGTATAYAADETNVYFVASGAICSVPINGGMIVSYAPVTGSSVSGIAVDGTSLFWGDTSGGSGSGAIQAIPLAPRPNPPSVIQTNRTPTESEAGTATIPLSSQLRVFVTTQVDLAA
jgi:hypothetical protein